MLLPVKISEAEVQDSRLWIVLFHSEYSGIIAESFGAIYERNAINAAFPVITCNSINDLDLSDGDRFKINLKTGEITNLRNNLTTIAEPFSEVQYEIYQKGSLLG